MRASLVSLINLDPDPADHLGEEEAACCCHFFRRVLMKRSLLADLVAA
jgi:hypothetical protein